VLILTAERREDGQKGTLREDEINIARKRREMSESRQGGCFPAGNLGEAAEGAASAKVSHLPKYGLDAMQVRRIQDARRDGAFRVRGRGRSARGMRICRVGRA
jgi:hypothetical protein